MAFALTLVACTSPANQTTRTVRGVLVDVQSRGLQALDEFTLRTDAGAELVFHPAPDFGRNGPPGHTMTPGHLREHMALAEPVTVTYRDEGGALVALSATD